MNRTPEEHGLKIGARFKHIRIVTRKDGGGIERRGRKGVVTDIYKHIFRAKMDGHAYYECFPMEMLEANHTDVIRMMK